MAESMFGNMYDARQKDMEASRSAAVDAASLGGYKTMAAVAGEMGGMLGGGIASAFGALPPEQAKQAKIDELMSQFPNPTTYEDYKTIAGEFMTAGMQEQGERFLGLAEDMKTTDSASIYLANKRLRNEKALAIQQAFGPTNTIEKKEELMNKLIATGYGDSTITTGLASAITTLKAAGLAGDKEERIAAGAAERERIAREKERRLVTKQEQDIKYKGVTDFNKGKADAAYYFSVNEPDGFSDEDKKLLIGKVGVEISNYDNILSTEATRGQVTPAVAAGYYTKVLDLPTVYTADPEFKFGDTATWGTDAAFSANNFTKALDTVFGRSGAVVKAQDVAMYSKLGLIVPMVTKVTINGKTGVLTPGTIAKLRLKYSK